MENKNLLTHQWYLNTICLVGLLLAFTSCESKMDLKAVGKYFEESPAVYLYATCGFSEEQPDLKDDFLGKDNGRYYYKAYNYKVLGIKDFAPTDISIEGSVILEPANETIACKKFDAEREHTPHKAQAETKMECPFVFKKIEGKWRLTKLESKQYLRTYWDRSEGYSSTKYKDLIELDVLRHRTSKNFEY